MWVDYNDLDEHDWTHTLREHCDGPVEVGQLVQTYDGEGNECPGVVISASRRGGLLVRIYRVRFVAGEVT